MVEHHHKSCAGVLLQVWCPHHVARRLGHRVCCCLAGQEPWRSPTRAVVEASKSWWVLSALQPSAVLAGRGNQLLCPSPCLQTFRLTWFPELTRFWGEATPGEDLDSSHNPCRSRRAQNNHVPLLRC